MGNALVWLQQRDAVKLPGVIGRFMRKRGLVELVLVMHVHLIDAEVK